MTADPEDTILHLEDTIHLGPLFPETILSLGPETLVSVDPPPRRRTPRWPGGDPRVGRMLIRRVTR